MNHTEDGKNKMISLLGTAVFHALIIMCLLLIYLKAPANDSMMEWGGVPVMFGNVADAYGNDEPFGRAGTDNNGSLSTNDMEPTVPQEAYTPPANSKAGDNSEPIATQEMEESVAINKTAINEVNRKRDEELAQQRHIAEQKRVADALAVEQRKVAATQQAAQDAEKKKIASLMGGAFGNGTGSGSRGETQGTGTQGVPTGNASHGKTTGIGGWGSFDLGGRSLGSGGLVKPNYTVNDYGTVVVDIVVNPQGAVVEASIGKGTNTTSAVLKQEALKAARQTKFNIVDKIGNQKGNITYKFNLN